MKNVFKFMFVLLMSSTVMFTSCSDSNPREIEEASLETKLSNDNDLKEALNQLVTLAELKANSASETEVNAAAGDIAISLVKVYERNPELGNMNETEVAAVFSKVIANNESLMDIVTGLDGAAFKKCPLKDVCKLAVTIGNLFLKPVLCDAIVGAVTIPVVGPALCNIAMILVTGLLNGVCDIVPC